MQISKRNDKMATTNFKESKGAISKKTKEIRRKKRKKRLISALVVVLVLSVLALCALSLTVFFKTAKIDVKGNTVYTAEEIISVAGIDIGDNLILISDKRVEETLKVKLPFVNEVNIERSFPDTLKITVKETKEEICFANSKAYYSANKDGKILKKYKATPENLIRVTVSDKVEFKTGRKVIFSNEREEELYNNFFNMINTYNYDVSFVNISDPFSSYMKLEDRIIVKMGSSSYFQNKSDYLKASLTGIGKEDEGVFDLSAWTPENNQPVLTYCDISSYEK